MFACFFVFVLWAISCWELRYARHCVKCSTCIISYNLHSNPKMKLRLRKENHIAQCQLRSGRAGSGTQACLAQDFALSVILSSLLELFKHRALILTWQKHLFIEQNLPLICLVLKAFLLDRFIILVHHIWSVCQP